MKKFLLALGVLAFLATAGIVTRSAPIPLFTPTGPCAEPSQLLNCVNNLINLLNGQGQTALFDVGATGRVSGATPLTLNTQSGIAQFTGVTVAGNANSSALVLNNSLVAANSSCNVTINTTTAAGGSGPTVRSATPTAGVLTILLTNATATTTGASNFDLAFWCQ
jgi:hypothetical protein